MILRFSYLFICVSLWLMQSAAQCGTGISSFPYNEGFETSDGGWVSGGPGNDWAWGTPAKAVISGAGGGTKCWVVGGLTGASYTNSEASWLQSPCFNFTNLQYPYIEFRVNWETEKDFDGGSLQYSLDNGGTWSYVGSANDPVDCLNANWFNHASINFLSPFGSARNGWSGNIQASGGSCRGGAGSNGWLVAKHCMPYLAGKPGVLFRFVFGAGAICNDYDGFAVDDIMISEAPPNAASFTYACVNSRTVNFTNSSALCPSIFSWDFGDPGSGTANTSSLANPSHLFSGPGKYTVRFTAESPGNAPSTTTKVIYIIGAEVIMLQPVDCSTNTGGSLTVNVTGADGIPLNLLWNSSPPQTGTTISGLAEGFYSVAISGTDVCPVSSTGKAEKELSCIGIYFPSAFTPNDNGRNEGFGPLGSLLSLSEYRLSVYNRWGERIFFSTDPTLKWDGKVRGQKTDGNIFAWHASFVMPGKGRQERKGTVVLVR